MKTTQTTQDKSDSIKKEREKLLQAGISWPPEPWQRVEITGNRFHGDPDVVLGTVLTRNGSYTEVLLDHTAEIRNCYWDNELRPVLTKELGWVPLALYKQCLIDWTKPTALDLKLTNGRWAFNCWPKRDAANFYTFNEMDRPHGRYTEHHVTAVRPAE